MDEELDFDTYFEQYCKRVEEIKEKMKDETRPWALDDEEVVYLDTNECSEAVQSILPTFKPNWTGQQLLDFYEKRELTFAQLHAILHYEKTRAKMLEGTAEAKRFLEDGAIHNTEPDWPKVFRKLGWDGVPWKKIFKAVRKRLPDKAYGKKLENKLEFKGIYLACDGSHTDLTCGQLERFWNEGQRLLPEKKIIKMMARIIAERVNNLDSF